MENKKCQDVPEGNTKTSGPNHAKYRWVFTLPYEEITAEDLCHLLREFCKEFYFQGELSKTGYKHWQGCFSLITKHRFSEVVNILGNQKFHIEVCINWFKSKNYCSKDDTAIAGERYNHNSIFIKTIKDLYAWQKDIEDKLNEEPDERSINWYYDKEGGIGKSAFCKYMCVKHNVPIITSGSKKDIAYALPENPKMIIFDFTRDIEDFVSYSALEECKNGMIFSAKYASKMKCFNSPHIIVFSNFKPDKEKMSKDRWNIYERKGSKFER